MRRFLLTVARFSAFSWQGQTTLSSHPYLLYYQNLEIKIDTSLLFLDQITKILTHKRKIPTNTSINDLFK